MSFIDPYRKDSDGIPSEFGAEKSFIEKTGLSIKGASLFIVGVTVILLSVSNYILGSKSSKNQGRIEQYVSQIEALKASNEKYADDQEEYEKTIKNREQTIETLDSEILGYKERMKNYEKQLRENTSQEIYSDTASSLIDLTLDVIDSGGYRLNKKELVKAVSRKYKNQFSSKDREKLKVLKDDFNDFDLDSDGYLDRKEVALAVFQ